MCYNHLVGNHLSDSVDWNSNAENAETFQSCEQTSQLIRNLSKCTVK